MERKEKKQYARQLKLFKVKLLLMNQMKWGFIGIQFNQSRKENIGKCGQIGQKITQVK